MTTTAESFPDYYKVLGVGRHCSIEKIKAAYKALALVLHPDKNQGDGTATEIIQSLVGAYSILKDFLTREGYNFEYDQLQRNGRICQANIEHGEVERKFDNRGRIRRNHQAKGAKLQRGRKQDEEKGAHLFQRHLHQQKTKTKRERRNKAQSAVESASQGSVLNFLKNPSAALVNYSNSEEISSNEDQLISVMQTGKVKLPPPQHNSPLIDEFSAEADYKNSRLPVIPKEPFVHQTKSDLTRLIKVCGIRVGGNVCTHLQKLPKKLITAKELGVYCGERKLRNINNRPKVCDEFVHDRNLKTAFKSWKEVSENVYLRSVREAEPHLKILPADAPRLRKHNDPKIASVDPFLDLENLVPCWDA
jgi:curved DNA-binding protein CbpA